MMTATGKPNSVWFRFTNVTVLDIGTFGTVYRAMLSANGNDRPRQTVAIKRIRLSGNGGGYHELKVYKKLQHQNIIPLLFYFYSGNGTSNMVNLVMECAPTNLDHVIRHYASVGRTMSTDFSKLYVYQLFRSLRYMHETAGLCHRDVKPRNLLLYPATGVLKLCDFGSAKDLSDGRPNSGYVCSRRYRAPELLFAKAAVLGYTTAIDVWSAGCVYIEMLTGAPAFPGSSVSHQRALVVRPPALPAATPADVTGLVMAALRRDPSVRPTALQACDHECFDVLRRPDVRLPGGRPLPPLFDDDGNETTASDLGRDRRPDEQWISDIKTLNDDQRRPKLNIIYR